jgi:hypothetical protein
MLTPRRKKGGKRFNNLDIRRGCPDCDVSGWMYKLSSGLFIKLMKSPVTPRHSASRNVTVTHRKVTKNDNSNEIIGLL